MSLLWGRTQAALLPSLVENMWATQQEMRSRLRPMHQGASLELSGGVQTPGPAALQNLSCHAIGH